MEEEETQLKDAESVEDMDEQTVQLKALGINVVDQSDLEQSVEAVVEKAAAKHVRKQRLQILKKDVKNGHLEILKLKKKKSDVDFKISGMRQRLVDPRKFVEAENTLKSIKAEIETHSNRIRYIEDKLKLAEEDESVIDDVDIGLEEGEIVDEGPEEEFSALDKEKMIKSGAMTPFGTLMSSGSAESKSDEPSVPPFELGDTRDSMKVEEMKNGETSSKNIPQKNNSSVNNEFEKYIQDQMAKQNLYSRNESIKPKSSAGSFGKHKQSRKRLKEFQPIPSSSEPITKRRKKSSGTPKNNTLKYSSDTEDESFKPEDLSDQDPSGSDYVPSEDSDEDLTCVVSKESDKLALKNKKTSVKKKFKKITDDGHVKSYIRRIHSWKKKRLKEKHRKILEGESEDEEEEFERFERGYKIPLSIWNKLFKYQRTCVKWLWELNCQKCGGILGDEMGLGKTVMVISYLAGLSFSGLMSPCRRFRGLGPVLIVCPVTVLQQWLRELHKWWPMFRVAVLHESGSFTGKRPSLIHCINKNNGILITSYQGVISQIKSLLNYDWHYVILDEGHKIRNPEAQITVALKRFDTPHRIILSGSPIQNSLKELWSLFDFVFPGKLGTLPVFMQQFAVPITQGGYANANKLEVQTAFRCATVLRDTINPYLLRRMKNDVRDHLSLPNKSEQVLFCDLTEEQRRTYRQYLDSKEVSSIMSGRLQVFVGLINLRKICNHPDLYDGGMRILDQEASNSLQPEMEFGWYKRSGKMMVLEAILKLWKKQGHRVLLFSQSRQMISILEKFLISRSYSYLKMDGTTSISSRQPLIQRFNENASHFVFLLTTRVGGLGVNLIGADRVVIYDPDWNPSTDTQARERAWRIGQTRQVTIYRLLTAGTIEEKIYHRQIFKQFITNKVLKDPKQQRFFKSNDLFELFTLSEGKKEKTESSAIFAGIGSEIKFKKNKSRSEGTETVESLSEEVEKTKSQARTAVAKAKIPKTKAVMHKPKTGTPRKVAEPSNPNAEIIFQKAEPFKLKSEVPLQKSESIELNGEVPNQNTETLDQKSDVSIKVEVPDSVTEMANSQIVQTETTLPEDETINKVYPVPSCSKESNVDGTEILQNGFSDKSEPENSLGSSENNAESENRCDNDLKIELNKSNIDEDERTRIMREKARLLSKKISQMKFKTNQKDSSESTRKKKKKGKKFEGERIQGLLKVRQFKYTKDDTENESKSDKSHDEEVLRELFKKTSVHSAFSHDVIVNSSDPDYLLLQTEADRVAKEALRQVRLSRARCSRFKNKPDTSKKKFGVKRSSVLQDDDSGSTSKKETLRNNDEEDDKKAPKILQEQIGSTSDRTEVNGSTSGALSSAELLKRMKERNKTKPNIPTSTNSSRFTSPRFSRMDESSSDSDESCPDISEDPEIQPHVELLTDIRNFIAFQAEVDGQATTKEVIHKFRDRLPPSQNHIFKALLKEICDFVRDSAGHGVWYIKGEFR